MHKLTSYGFTVPDFGARFLVAALLLLTIVALPSSSSAGAKPEKIILNGPAIAGDSLRVRTRSGERTLSVAEIERLPTFQVTTSTFWPGDDGTYQGVLLADFLKLTGIDGAKEIRVTAIDGFSQIIPSSDWQRWPVVLATRRDGKPLTIRAKGPARVIYPRDMDPQLSESVYRLRWVWLIKLIESVEN
ncbi:MAG: molybdopterin-dependent oxidoreductase [Proteobacteria bacterium]|nr:molybdopterin-dependent oxidoreductase [Pseudomonadota bacterium]